MSELCDSQSGNAATPVSRKQRRPLNHGFRALGRMLEDSLIAQDAAADIMDQDLSRHVQEARLAIIRAGNRMAVLRREEFPESGEAA